MSLGRGTRDDFLLEPGAFLNHGSFGACPRAVLAAQRRWQERMESQPLRFMVRELEPALDAVCERVAPVLGARGRDVVLVENATTGVLAVLDSLDLRAGDEILTTTHVYGAVRQGLRWLADRRGVVSVEVPVPFPIRHPEEVVETVRLGLGPRTRAAVLDHITSASGLVLPVGELVSLCHEAGVPVLVDGAHAPGQVPLDLEALGADWYTGNAHKWLLAPKGCALLWAREGRQDLHPRVISHSYGQGWRAEFGWTGTRDPTPWLALPAALDYLETLGLDVVMEHNRSLAARAGALLAEAWGVELPSPPSMRAALCALRCPLDLPAEQDHAVALNRWLWDVHRIEVPLIPFLGRLWVRIAAQIYNDLEEYALLAEVLPRYSTR